MMTNQMNEQEIRAIAKERIAARKDFRLHILTYITVNIGLIAIYMITNFGGYPWFLWVIFGWGIGLLMNYFKLKSISSSNPNDELRVEIERVKKMNQ